jgi:dihydroxy-acid dehydratase
MPVEPLEAKLLWMTMQLRSHHEDNNVNQTISLVKTVWHPKDNSHTNMSGQPSDSLQATKADYDLSQPLTSGTGLRQGLASYGDAHFSLFLRKVFIKALGYSEEALSRPIIGIVNTYSGFNPCHGNVPQLIEAVKRGIHLNGGLAVEFPTISIHESFSSPTSMYLRNLMSMDTEEMVKAQPVDSVVLIGG